ncbi:replication initiator protein [Microvirus D_HF5_96]|nr:replication initiator protein [Microvirus D_HF5_96]
MHPLVELVKEKEVLLPCEDPVVVENNGRKYAVPCGKCMLCLERKANIWRTRLRQECKDNKYCIFFTLTYDNLHVPFFRPAEDADCYILDNAKGYRFQGDDETSYSERLSVRGSLCRVYTPRITNFDVCNSFAVVSRLDVQKFMKRFRWHLEHLLTKHYKLKFYDKIFTFMYSLGYTGDIPFREWLDDLDDETYDLYLQVYYYYLLDYENKKKQAKQVTRYFICSEYTPTTFRPHYHGLFWFDNEKAYKFAFRCIYKAWQMCDKRNIDVQPVTGGDAYSYVSKYVTGNLNLPEVLRVKSSRTFCLASKNPAVGYKSYDADKVQGLFNRQNIFRRDVTVTRDGQQSFVSVVPPCVVSRYFPKCYRYGTLSDMDKLRVYTRFIKLSKVNGVERIDFEASLACLKWYKDNTLLYSKRAEDELGDTYNSQQSWFHSADVNAARACLNWCIRYNCHPSHYMCMLDWFWKEYAMYNLYQQYHFMDKLSRTFVWKGDEVYKENCDVKLFDVQMCLDPVFLRELPLYLDDAVLDDDICSTVESFGMDISSFYDIHGMLSEDVVRQFYEYNMKHFSDYRSRAYDNLKFANKSKEANSYVIDCII